MTETSQQVHNGNFQSPAPVTEWDMLQPGDRIEVHSDKRQPYIAYVDVCAADGQTIWITEEGAGGRRLFLRDDPVLLFSG